MQALVIMALLPPSAPFAPARGMSGRNLRLSPSAALAPIEGTSGRNRDVATVLTMASDGESSSRDNNKKKSSGVYARPSAAIERGSGFFIPGLEGSRVRLLFGILALSSSRILELFHALACLVPPPLVDLCFTHSSAL